jgi:hypothetical protein
MGLYLAPGEMSKFRAVNFGIREEGLKAIDYQRSARNKGQRGFPLEDIRFMGKALEKQFETNEGWDVSRFTCQE